MNPDYKLVSLQQSQPHLCALTTLPQALLKIQGLQMLIWSYLCYILQIQDSPMEPQENRANMSQEQQLHQFLTTPYK